ncbi:MAG TPA: methyltransferase domain-containing protein, partial [Anaerolineae bacterium]
YRTADMTAAFDTPPLDGVVIANALHFMRDKARVLQSIKRRLQSDGRLILVEYNVDQGNMWVPYPLAYPTWQALAESCGFVKTELLATVPSRFLGEIYSALCLQS